MECVTDLHLHSKYSRAVSQNMTLQTMSRFAKLKGLDVLSASDWMHPLWMKELQLHLEEKQEGLYGLKNPVEGEEDIRFLLSTEISSIYKEGEKLRRIHNLVFAPNFQTAEKINKELLKRGCNLSSDGRPIVGISSRNLLELILTVDERCLFIPAHIWTPHFGIYGSQSGYDSLEEAFGDLSQYIYGIETGLSSDPDMNWQTKELKNRSILSFSDAHSAPKMGREATVIVTKNMGVTKEITYEDIRQVIMRKSPHFRIGYTIEFYPEEGKYHFSGHRNCNVSLGPEEIKKGVTQCPVCRRRMTEGVLYRVQQLSDEALLERVVEKNNTTNLKWYTDAMRQQPPYVKLVQLQQIIAESMEATVLSQKVQAAYVGLCKRYGSEIDVLLRTPIETVSRTDGERLAEGVARVRSGNIAIVPGYDGEYGKVTIYNTEEKQEDLSLETSQLGLEL